MRLILHIGEGKTGTTSIQNALFLNQEKLLENKILCHMDNANQHFRLIYLVGGKARVSSSKHNELEKEALHLIASIKKKVKLYKPKVLLLSAESLFALKLNQQQQLLDAIGLNFSEINIIAYIRSPVDNYFSRAQQMIKADYNFSNPNKYSRNISSVLKLWAKTTKKKNILIRPFLRTSLYKQNVVSDFMHNVEKITGITFASDIEMAPKDSNISLTAEQMIVLQQYRKNYFPSQNGITNPESNEIIHFFQKISTLDELPTKKAKLKKYLRGIIYQNNKKFLEEIDSIFEADLVDKFSEQSFELTGIKKKDNKDYSNISSIIECYNLQTVKFLQRLIPENNKELNFDYKHPVFSNPFFCLHYGVYLINRGFHSLGYKFLIRSYSFASEAKINKKNIYDHLKKYFLKIDTNEAKQIVSIINQELQ